MSPKLEQALALIDRELRNGPRLASEMTSLAQEAGITAITLRRAREVRGVVSSNDDGWGASWKWELPTAARPKLTNGEKQARAEALVQRESVRQVGPNEWKRLAEDAGVSKYMLKAALVKAGLVAEAGALYGGYWQPHPVSVEQVEAATRLLRATLADGPVQVAVVCDQAWKDDISGFALKKARAALGNEITTTESDDQYYWALAPAQPLKTKKPQAMTTDDRAADSVPTGHEAPDVEREGELEPLREDMEDLQRAIETTLAHDEPR